MHLIKFNLEKALNGATLITKGGKIATDFRRSSNVMYPYRVTINGKEMIVNNFGKEYSDRDSENDLLILVKDEKIKNDCVPFKKSDLKTGHIVEIRSGERGTVIKDNVYNEDAIVFRKGVHWTPLSSYKHNLKYDSDVVDMSDADIVKVYKPDLPTGMLTQEKDFKNGLKLVWSEEMKESKVRIEFINPNGKMTFQDFVLKEGFRVSKILIDDNNVKLH